MARIRTIKPSFWKHEELSALPAETHMLAAALLNYADDDGYFNANPRLVQSETVPLRELSVSVPESLRNLQSIGFIRLGKGADGKQYGQIVKFSEHQTISHKQTSKIQGISIAWEGDRKVPGASSNAPGTLHHEWNGMEEEGNKELNAAAAAVAPATLPVAEPVALQEVKPPSDVFELGRRVCAIAGIPEGRLVNELGTMKAWTRFDPELDVIACVSLMVTRDGYSAPKGLNYFTGAISRFQKDRLSPATHVADDPKMTPGRRSNGQGKASHERATGNGFLQALRDEAEQPVGGDAA